MKCLSVSLCALVLGLSLAAINVNACERSNGNVTPRPLASGAQVGNPQVAQNNANSDLEQLLSSKRRPTAISSRQRIVSKNAAGRGVSLQRSTSGQFPR